MLPRKWRLDGSAKLARLCKKSACPSGVPEPEAFELRVDHTTGEFEPEVSVHWLNFFTPHTELRERLAALCTLIEARYVDDEVKLDRKRSRFVVVDVGKLQREVQHVDEVNASARSYHTPRFCGDSHSSIFPRPAVDKWPKDRDAYHFALKKLLADCCEPAVHTPTF